MSLQDNPITIIMASMMLLGSAVRLAGSIRHWGNWKVELSYIVTTVGLFLIGLGLWLFIGRIYTLEEVWELMCISGISIVIVLILQTLMDWSNGY